MNLLKSTEKVCKCNQQSLIILMCFVQVNLRYGVKHGLSRTGSEKDTCTSCAGTMILEFSALSRLTGDTIYEEKAARAMDYLWKSRHRASDLVGTVINIHNGDWVRRGNASLVIA